MSSARITKVAEAVMMNTHTERGRNGGMTIVCERERGGRDGGREGETGILYTQTHTYTHTHTHTYYIHTHGREGGSDQHSARISIRY